MSWVLEAAGALAPSVGVGLIFWFAIRSILGADQRERAAMRRYEAEQDRGQAQGRRASVQQEEPADGGTGSSTGAPEVGDR